MKKYFVVADVHGFYDEMIKALNENNFDINNPDHIFISLGDLLDRGRQPRECLDFVNNLPDDRKILIYIITKDTPLDKIKPLFLLNCNMCHRSLPV